MISKQKSIQHIEYIHEMHLVNQGYRFCNLGFDCGNCDSCENKESRDIEVESSWTSYP